MARGSMEYSAVTQPAPSGTWGGTLSSTLAQQRTMVSPHWMRQLPSANFTKLGVMVTGRLLSVLELSWGTASSWGPSARISRRETLA